MPLIVALIFLFISNWVISELLVFFPIHLLDWVRQLGWFCLIYCLLLLFGWFFGDD